MAKTNPVKADRDVEKTIRREFSNIINPNKPKRGKRKTAKERALDGRQKRTARKIESLVRRSSR